MPEEKPITHRHSSINSGENPERVRGSDFVSVYSNQAQVTSSPFDVRIIFAEMLPNERGEVNICERVGVVMSPLHAKALFMLLGQNIQRHERAFGEINLGKLLKMAEDDAASEEAPDQLTLGDE